jgi:hypothetical protein
MMHLLARAVVFVVALLGAHAATASALPTLASEAQGRAILAQRDDFVAMLSPFDRAARLKTDADVSEQTYLDFVGQNVIGWSDAEQKRVTAALKLVQDRLHQAGLQFPEGVVLIHTTGREEGGAAYTRGDAIVLSSALLESEATDAKLAKLLSHELFHIISRRDPRRRDALYRVIGFEACPEYRFPTDLAARRITNPDAPHNDHRIKITYRDRSVWAIPVLYSDQGHYDRTRGGEFFDYLQFRLALERVDAASPGQIEPDQFVTVKDVSGFFDQVGHNTNYIIHAEEILAENFALALSGETAVTPAIPQAILRALRQPVPPTSQPAGRSPPSN